MMAACSFRCWVAFCSLVLCVAWAPRAAAQLRTCVSVAVPEGENATEFLRLVKSELDRHRSHRASDGDCQSHLLVEWIVVDAGQYLTARMNDQVPARVAVGQRGLEAALVELLSVALENDPVRLHGPRDQAWLTARLVDLRRGRSLYRFELGQVTAWTGSDAQSLAALGLGFAREISAWELGVRLVAAGRFNTAPGRLQLDQLYGVRVGVRYFFSAEADTAGYLGGGFGLQHQRYRGPEPMALGGSDEVGFDTVPIAVLEGGVELFRTTTMRIDFGVSLSVPLTTTHDVDTEVVDAWVPTGMLHTGVAL